MGEVKKSFGTEEEGRIVVDTFGGRVHVEWDPSAAVTPLGQMAFFIEFLKTGGLYEPWVSDAPLHYTSSNAPMKADVLGTVLLSVLAGHKRYAHITTVRADNVNPELLGMTKVVSEDAVRRAFGRMDQSQGMQWLTNHLGRCYEGLLDLPWILDGDTTVKPLYGCQEGAVVGYNPKKPGRPSHACHSYLMANTRLVLDVEVQAGNATASSYNAPGLWALLDRIPRSSWPAFFRGDCGWGTEGFMSRAEERGLAYLSKLRLTKNVKRLIEKAFRRDDWENAGQGWEGREERLQLVGWSISRRVIVLRRILRGEVAITEKDKDQMEAITSRPLLLYAVGKQTRHQGQTTVTMTSTHAKTDKIQQALKQVTRFLQTLKSTAEQLTQPDRWRLILSRAFRQLLKGKPLPSPALLPHFT